MKARGLTRLMVVETMSKSLQIDFAGKIFWVPLGEFNTALTCSLTPLSEVAYRSIHDPL